MKAHPTPPSSPRSLCLLRLSALGDVANTVPLVRTLRYALPDTSLTWIIGEEGAELVGDLEGVEFLVFSKGATARSLVHLQRTLRGRRFDVLLHAQASWRANLASLAVPARLRIGLDHGRDFQRLFVQRTIAPGAREHTLDRLFGFSRALGIADRRLEWPIPVPEEARERARQLAPPRQRTVVISPSSSAGPNDRRNWLTDRYARVADHAVARHGCRVLLTGGPSPRERAFLEGIRTAMTQPATNLAGQTSLKELLALLREAVVLIAPDSGPAHMATAVGTPVIGLFAVSNPERSGPYLSRQWWVNRYPEALRAAHGRTTDQAPWGKRLRSPEAMALIDVDSVRERLDAALGHRHPTPATSALEAAAPGGDPVDCP